ncbi:carbohydrate ABC transporter permease [Lachnospiraceae bacterium]|nr:carbohydrate ABC transporter permease [Lachnospiraceae bacterium]
MKKIFSRRTGNPFIRFILMMFLIFFALFQIYPLIWLVFFSFKSNEEIFGGNILGPPKIWKIENYRNALMGGDVLTYLLNSIWISMAVIFLSTILIAMAAYAISRMKWKLSGVVYWIFMAGLTIPIHATLLPLFILFKTMGVLNTPLSLIIPYTAFALPFGIMVLRNHYETIPREMEEAACIDGCSIYQTFFHIILPLVRPALATIAIFSFLSSWNELMFAMTFISDTKYKTLTVGLQSLTGMYYTEWGPVGAGMVVAALPVLIIYVLLSKQVQNAMLAGATKG